MVATAGDPFPPLRFNGGSDSVRAMPYTEKWKFLKQFLLFWAVSAYF